MYFFVILTLYRESHISLLQNLHILEMIYCPFMNQVAHICVTNQQLESWELYDISILHPKMQPKTNWFKHFNLQSLWLVHNFLSFSQIYQMAIVFSRGTSNKEWSTFYWHHNFSVSFSTTLLLLKPVKLLSASLAASFCNCNQQVVFFFPKLFGAALYHAFSPLWQNIVCSNKKKRKHQWHCCFPSFLQSVLHLISSYWHFSHN